MGEVKNALKTLVAKPVGKGSLVELKLSFEDDNRTNLTEMRYTHMCVYLIRLAQNGMQ
jgi:hypothetical protein